MAVTQAAPGFPELSSPESASVQALRPRLREDVFLLEQEPLPTFKVGIEKAPVIHRTDLDTEYTTFYQRKVTMSDGTRFSDLTGLSKNPAEPVAIASVPAWWTDPFGGFNLVTNKKLGELGRHTYTKGIANNRPHSLYRNSWDLHVALESAAETFDYEFDGAIFDAQGDSNGAMTITGAMAYAEAFGHVVRDAFPVDPCIVQKIGREEVTKFIKHPEYPIRELVCLGKQILRIARNPDESAREYVGTIEVSPEFIISNLLLVRGLFWGELGHLLAHVDNDQVGHYRLFEHSIGNQKRRFHQILRGSLGDARPLVTTETISGTHLSIANPRTMEAKIDFFKSRVVA